MAKVGLFGGTFNPFHMGHLHCLLSVKDKAKLDHVYVLPAYQNPLKSRVDGPTPQQRLEMAQIALRDYDDVEVDDREIQRKGPSYTIDTIKEYAKEYDAEELYLILGMDQFEEFDRWKRFEKVLEHCNVLVAARPQFQFPFSVGDLPRGIQPLVEQFENNFVFLSSGNHIEFIRIPESDVSATDIRKRLRTGRNVDKGLDIEVEAYIREHHLYEPVGPKIGDYEVFTRFCAELLDSRKAIQVKAFDLRELSSVSEYTLIASGTSTRHTSSLAELLIDQVKHEYGVLPEGIEGLGEGRWVLVDYGALIVHIFYDYVRQEYRLEELWKEGMELKLDLDPSTPVTPAT